MIRLENVTAGYEKTAVVKDINIEFEEGTITSIIGKNGCGKTTLLRTAANVLKPFSGKVSIHGEDVSEIPPKELAKKVSFLPQIRTVPNITVFNLVLHGRYPYLGFSRTLQKKDKEIVNEAIFTMGLCDIAYRNVLGLSGGQRQKVYLAMVLAQDTDIVFLDEPTTYLDINHQLEILEMIRKLKDMGKTVVMVLHDLNSALTYSGKVCLMHEGKIVCCDTPQNVFESKLIDEVFGITSSQVMVGKNEIQYVFCLN